MFSYKNVHQQVNIFNKTIVNIFSNFIQDKLVTFDDKDSPWMKKNKRKNKGETKTSLNHSKLLEKITSNSAARLTSIKFDSNGIFKIISSLNVNKANGHGGISVRMIKT